MTTLDTRLPGLDQDLGQNVARLEDIAGSIRDQALNWAASGMGPLERSLELIQSLTHPGFIDRFRYGMAKGVVEAMAAGDRHLMAAYLYEGDGGQGFNEGTERSLDMSIHLLALVEKPSAALLAYISSLDRALLESCKKLPTQLFADRGWILDVKVLSVQEVQERRGYASLLYSTFAPALKIWERQG